MAVAPSRQPHPNRWTLPSAGAPVAVSSTRFTITTRPAASVSLGLRTMKVKPGWNISSRLNR